MMVFNDYDEAAGNSRSRKAISLRSWDVELPRGVRKLRIVKPSREPPIAVYATAPSIKCPEWDFPYSLVDSITEWEPF